MRQAFWGGGQGTGKMEQKGNTYFVLVLFYLKRLKMLSFFHVFP